MGFIPAVRLSLPPIRMSLHLFVNFVRILGCALSLAVWQLSSYVANWYDHDTTTPAPWYFRFLIFTPLWALFVTAYAELTPRYYNKAFRPLLAILLETITTLLYMAGFIALSVFLAQLKFCRGDVCRTARAEVVLAAVSFPCFLISTSYRAWEYSRKGYQPLRGGSVTREEMAAAD